MARESISAAGVKPKPLTTRVERNIDLGKEGLPAEVEGKKSIGVQWTGTLTAPTTGDYMIGMQADGFARVSVDGKMVALQYGSQGVETHLGRVHLVKGEKTALEVQYRSADDRKPVAKLIWAAVERCAFA